MGREEVKGSDKVVGSCWRIARESSESAYIRAREREGNTEIVDNRNSVE